MDDNTDDLLAENVAKRVVKTCDIRHERLEKLEHLASKTAQVVHGHGVRLNDMDERIAGLHQAHTATLIAVEACTHSTDRLSSAIDRLEGWLMTWTQDYEKHKNEFMQHKESNSTDKLALPRVALWLWLMTITAFGSVVAFFIAEWHEILAVISKLP